MASNKLDKLRIQILHWNRPEECARTVEYFLREVPPESITVIDNGSTSENLAQLKSLLPAGVKVLPLEKNLGWGGGHNVGLKQWLEHETSEFCVACAHDALPEAGCVAKLVNAMQENQQAGMICPQYDTGEVGVFHPIRGPKAVLNERGSAGTIRYMDFIHGTLMLFRRDCLKQTGLFDERYFAYGDEFDLALRARNIGWKVGMLWGAIVVNPGTSVARPVVTYLCTRGTLLLARDHGGRVAAGIRALLVVVNSLRMSFKQGTKRDAFCHPKTRMVAVRDYYLGRFGAPPPLK
jgi:GT2 family glycosyltransferase